MGKYNGLWIGQLGNANSWYHIYPFAMARSTSKLHVVRHSAPYNPIPKSVFYSFKKRSMVYNCIALFIQSQKVIRNNKIDFIITFNPAPYGSVAWLISKIYKIPISIGLIGTDFNIDLQKKWYKGILLHVLRKSDFISITGSAMRPYLELKRINHFKIGIFPHCVSDSWLINNRNRICAYDLISVGWMHKEKRFADTIEALSILKKRGYNLKLIIIGEGSERNYLKEKIDSYKLEKFVEMPGYKSNILTYFKDSKIFVQSSEKEGLSISLIEAMALGLVPVVTKAGSEEDIITDDTNGFIVNVGKPDEIANAIEALCNEDTYNKFHENLLATRDKFRMKTAILAADEIVNKIVKQKSQ